VADAVPPIPPFVELTLPVVLTSAPAVVPLTLTLIEQLLLIGIEPPDKVMLVAPATGANVPPQVFVAVGVASTSIPVGNESVTPTPVKATVFDAGLVTVMVKVEMPLTPISDGENDFAIVGGEATVNVNVGLVVAPQLSVKVTVTVYVPGGFALAIVTTPVVGLTAKVPVKPGAVAVALAIEPLSAGAAVGVTVVPPAGFKFVFAYVPTDGGVFGVTLTVNVALLDAPFESVTVSVKVAFVAVQEATISAVTLPAALTAMFETVTPLTVADAPPLTVTTKVFSVWSLSLTVAICEFADGLPCCRDTVAPVIVGIALTVN